MNQVELILKKYRREMLIGAGIGLSALTLGVLIALVAPRLSQWQGGSDSEVPEELDLTQAQQSAVLPLVALPAAERSPQLVQLAQSKPSTDQFRARYLLATDLIQQGKAGSALPLLQDLEQQYPVLAPQILAKRAQALTASGNAAQSKETWQALLQQFPFDPTAAEALYALGKAEPKYWDQAIAQFPSHPRSIQIAQTRLQQNPNQLPLLLLLANHGLYLPDISSVLDRLMNEFSDQLTQADWEAIAFGYWEMGRYGSAGYAYGKAAPTSLNLYRTARGAQLGERTTDAIVAYRKFLQAFPNAEETPLGMLRLARLEKSPQEALKLADQIIRQFPQEAPAALLERSKLLDQLNSPASASQTRKTLLSQYSSSEAAGDLRWQLLEQLIEANDIPKAWALARQFVEQNPDHENAPEAAFWIGKWATQLGREADAQQAFEYVVANFPASYYAWRSASYLGWDVGDFTTVRQKMPEVVQPSDRPNLLAGSEAIKELHLLGQNQDAWSQWQVEFTNVRQPTVAEQFTDGVLRLGMGDNLNGIFMVSSLSNRQKPQEKAEYQALKQQTAYWRSLYPFPFGEAIETWSQQRQLNPLLVTALIRQESRFEPEIVSVAGATGLMQLMPDTAAWVSDQLNLSQYDLNNPNDNINLGTWYLDFTHREFSNNSMFAVASYNAGPGAVAGWMSRFSFADPDRFVEQIPYPETKGYVASVFGNYWNYLRLYNPEVSQKLSKYSPKHVQMMPELPE
jgi:soluble lytic murein transglycosylase